MATETAASSITSILGRIFAGMHEPGAHTLLFDTELFLHEAARRGLIFPDPRFDLTDFVCYDPAFVKNRRELLPRRIRRTEPRGWQWRLYRLARGGYAFRLEPVDGIHPSKRSLLEQVVPDSMPEIISANALSDEQALLARVRYNRLIDIFLGITACSLQNHLRTTVKGLGQIEIDEVYVGVDRHGCQYIVPVQAKGGNDQLSTVQAKQDIACCAEKFPELVCRAISAQFMDDSRIALFELCVDEDGLVKTVDERHYRLVPADQIDGSDRRAYRTRAR
jgi:hypothetical protein